MAFSEKISVVIDLAADKAGASLKSFKSQVAEADGAVGKMKVGFGAAGNFMKANAAEFAASAGVALIGFAVKAVGEFNNLALAVGKTADATGVSSEAISRWAEVAGDVGVELGTVEKALLKMEEAAAKSPQAFADLGVEIARTADGAFDANETLIRAMETIGKMPNADERAAAGKKLLGKSWAEMAEIIESNDIRGALEGVSDAKVIDEKELAQARKFRDSMDELNGVIEDFTLSVGGSLVPVLGDLATDLGKATEAASKLGDVFNLDGQVLFKILMRDWVGAAQAMADQAMGTEDAVEDETEALEENATAVEEVKSATELATEAGERHAEALEATAQASRDAADALNEQVTAQRAAADAWFAAGQATDDYREFLQGAKQEIKDAKGDQEKLNGVYRDAALKAAAMADANSRVADELAAAEGKTRTATEKLDLWNRSMVDAASQASGPLRDSIIEYIAVANAIPAEKITDIKAALDAGDIAEAERIINQTSRSRTSTITADAETTTAEAKLNEAARTRYSTIYGNTVIRGPGNTPGPWAPDKDGDGYPGATGGIVTQPTRALIGEAGPEAVIPLNRAPGASPLPLGLGGGSTINVYVQAGIVANDVDQAVVEAIKRAERRGLM